MAVTKLNHAVLWVRDAQATAAFYRDVLDFEISKDAGRAVFLTAPGSDSDHDLGVFTLSPEALDHEAGDRRVGLYHLAWEVETLGELAERRERLLAAGALVGESDHGVSKSLYAKCPNGIEFEVMWQVPLEDLTDEDRAVRTAPLDLQADIARFGPSLTRGVGG